MVITIVNTKGGSGKTTAALILAGEFALNKTVTLIDADPSEHLIRWSKLKGCPDNITVKKCVDEKAILDEILDAVKKTDIVIVDLAGVASRLVSMAMCKADLVLIPTREQQQDASAVHDVIQELKRDMKMLERPIPYCVVFSSTKVVAKSRTSSFIREELKKNPETPTMDEEINERDAFAAMFSIGGTLHQLTHEDVNNLDKAKANASAFAAEVLSHLDEEEEEQAYA